MEWVHLGSGKWRLFNDLNILISIERRTEHLKQVYYAIIGTELATFRCDSIEEVQFNVLFLLRMQLSEFMKKIDSGQNV